MPSYLTSLAGAAPALAMLAIFALVAGGGWLIVKGGNRQKGVLMLVLAVVILFNVVILTM
jgi:hypothetical protein